MQKQVLIIGSTLLISIIAFTTEAACYYTIPKKDSVKSLVDWPTFLSRNDIVWEALPTKFDHGVFHGNGLMGCMIYQDSTNRMRWEAGHSDVTDHRRDNNRLPIGGRVLETVGKIKSGTSHLDLWNAASESEILTTQGSIKFHTYIHAIEMIMVVEVAYSEGERGAEFKWMPTPSVDFRNVDRFTEDLPNPPPIMEVDQGVSRCIQQRVGGG